VSAPETTSLLLEIGCEEIPARFVEEAEGGFGEKLRLFLLDSRLLVAPDGQPLRTRDEASQSPLQTYSTPRRLVAYMPCVLTNQINEFQRKQGPSVNVGIGPDGRYTRAAEAFAARNNATTADLKRITTAKGEYLQLEQGAVGEPALEKLVKVLEALLWNLYSFVPKNMYWTDKAGPLFVRPIRWILALLGEGEEAQVVPFEFAGVKSGQYTFGHRLKGGEPIRVTGFDDYLKKLREHWVEPDPSVRWGRIKNGIKVLLEGEGSRVVTDEFLESWVVNSTEWPTPIMGSFDERYLKLPREVLVTVMRDHQKYFAVEDKAGNLQPQFVTVLNVPGDPEGLIRQGHERVLAARFADAEFFWQADQKVPLDKRQQMLERVTYQAKLGTYGDKVRRMKALAEKICEEIEKSGSMNLETRQHALRAIELCKCDLATQMVQEFTELQGIMGGLYAKTQGEPQEVADAIYDHYRPAGVEDSCPRSVAGAVVSLADKLDSVVAGFAAGLEPTGSSDPFGLRRAGNGVVRVLLEFALPISLSNFASRYHQIVESLNWLGIQAEVPWSSVIPIVGAFFNERLRFYLENVAAMRYDTVRAVFAAAPEIDFAGTREKILEPLDIRRRADALEAIRDTEDFLALAAAAKRTRNIITKSAGGEDIGSRGVDDSKLTEGPERELYAAYQRLKASLDSLGARGDYEEAFRTMAKIRPHVDRFFDSVLVMSEDTEVRRNRLKLLIRLNNDVFTRLADLAEIVVEPRSRTAGG